MVDFVKFTVANFKEIATNPLLSFKVRTNRTNTTSFEVAQYKGIKFELKNTGYLIVSGSLHKYYNEGTHNHNDFTFSMLQLVIEDLARRFHFNVNDCYIHNIEFGVNIVPVVDTQMVLAGLMIHKTKEFSTIKQGHYRQAHHTQYHVKVYNKASQYGLAKQLMRYELKIVKMAKLKKCGIRKLGDLQENRWIESIQGILSEEWSEVLLFDKTIDIDVLDMKQELQLRKWSDSGYWKNLDKSKRSREKKKYREYIKQQSGLIQDRLSVVIHEKWVYLGSL